ncbi:MAG: carboxypeptidase regulatory-like domain-containing protein [Gemmatimonadetes bacterium]|nr:carboxypeptidase regulatory-like domain-containing protein [Gemmatimonadota bacterium]
MRPLRLSFALAALVLLPGALAAQSPADRLRGRVINDSAQAIVGATVFVTRGPDRLMKQTTTDTAGRWSVTFEDGTGDYLVAVRALGYLTARRRVQEDGPGPHSFTVDYTLSRDQSMLAAVKVVADKPQRANISVSPFNQETGANEKFADGVSGQLPPGTQGDLNALAATIPGITSGPNGPSLLGSGSESNLTTLNGMALPGGALPRAARANTRVTGATYDATRGGFSGANIDAQLGPGSRDFMRRTAYLTLDPAGLQYTDATGRALGLRGGSVKGSVGLDGELIRRALTYNVSLEGTSGTSDPATLLNADSATFVRAGVSPDSVARLRTVAGGLGIPLSGAGVPASRERSGLTWLGRLDDTRDTLDERSLTTYVSYLRSGALAFAPRSSPGGAGERTDRALGAQVQVADYFGEGRRTLNRVRVNVGQTIGETTPYLALPAASVLVNSVATDGSGLTTLGVGGSNLPSQRDTRWTAEASDELAWTAGGRRHLFKTIAWLRADGLEQHGLANGNGQYAFNSIAALQAGKPVSFTRTLSQPDRSGMAWNAAAAFTHQWAPSRTFSMIYGARVEANGFGAAPARNPALETALGVTTGATPVLLHVSPRWGFTWLYSRDKENGNGQNTGPSGTFFRNPTGVIRGGIGEFRDLLRPDVLADASARTGLAGSATTLACVGSAVPAPDWTGFAAGTTPTPSSCVGGGGIFTDLAPPATLIDGGYEVPRTWRATLDWSQNVGVWLLKVSAMGAMNLGLGSTIDANFAGTGRFALAGEGNRPVFVPVNAIDTASGALSSTQSRRASGYGQVGVRTGDLRGHGEQVTFTISPDVFKMRRVPLSPFVSLSYTLQRSERQYRGFDGAAFGDPRLVEWGPSPSDARHIFLLQGGFFGDYIGAVTFFARAQSGLPYTPLVSGDVNGDGRFGDRAFIPDPATTADTSLARQLRSLLANGSPTARECLAGSLGRVADRGQCRTPWSATMNLQWRLPLPGPIQRRFVANLYFENVLGAVDQWVHGAENLRGWGGPVNPDPVLLVPRGFDSTGKAFRYAVNPRFGETRPALTLDRAPFRITLDFVFRFHKDFDLQQLERALEPVKRPNGWEKRTADSLTTFYLRRTSSIYKVMLEESDSLFLGKQQMAEIQKADSAFTAQVRAVFVPLGRYLAEIGDAGPTKQALDSVLATEKAYWKVFWQQPEKADSLINAGQRELLPLLKGMLMTPMREREHSQWDFGHEVTLVDKPRGPAAPGSTSTSVSSPRGS